MFCPACGTSNSHDSVFCGSCGWKLLQPLGPAAAPDFADSRTLGMLVPLTSHPLVVIAGLIGLGSIVFFPLGPVALLIGILAHGKLGDLSNKRDHFRVWFAIVVGFIMSLLLLVMLAFILPEVL